MHTFAHDEWAIIATWIDDFESARRSNPAVNLTECLPAPQHPLCREITAELIRVDLEYSWADGRRKLLDDYHAVAPELFRDPMLLGGAAYEEFRLRRLAGETASPREYADRYGISTTDWRVPGDDNSQHGGTICVSEPHSQRYPQVGDTFVGFELEAVLGHGAFAAVFLARQADLARRPVALKVSRQTSLESQHLARLQHTNIVPIYSVHQTDEFVAVCMPYFGSLTLADALAEITSRDEFPTSGQAFLSTRAEWSDRTAKFITSETRTSQPLPDPRPSPAPAKSLEEKPYIESVIELVEQIAAGLQHAHERGIVHRDLKPANILLDDAGRPLLLDFNLSDDLVVNGPLSLGIGGTLPYMAPEHLQAVRDGGTVDARSDLFSLGVIMFELLTSRRPFDSAKDATDKALGEMIRSRSQAAPSPRSFNRQVPASVDAIVRKCLAGDRTRRYESAAELREDLQRHCQFLPLKHAANTSLVERLANWRRRHRRMTSAVSLTAAGAMLLSIFALLWTARGLQLSRLSAEQRYSDFLRELPAVRLAASVPDNDDRLLTNAANGINAVLSKFGWPEQDLRSTEAFRYLLPVHQAELSQQLMELSFLGAQINSTLALHASMNDGRQERFEQALNLNEYACRLSDATALPGALARQRQNLQSKLGQHVDEIRPSTASDGSNIHAIMEARSLLETQEFARAATLLESIVASHPTDAVSWLLLGNAKAALNELTKAEGCYTTAAALQPSSYVALYNRALCRLQQKHFVESIEDFDRVYTLKPNLPCVLLNQALAQEALGNLNEALANLNSAIATGQVPPRAYFLRARVRAKLGDRAGAEADRQEGLRNEPTDEVGWVAHGMALVQNDPDAALHDFRTALGINPKSKLALQNIVFVAADRTDKSTEALDALDQWVALDPKDWHALIGRAVLKARLGKRDESLADVDMALHGTEEPTALFQAACALSLTARDDNHDSDRALWLLCRAIEHDSQLIGRAERDPDLSRVRERPDFAQFVSSSAAVRELRTKLERRLPPAEK